MNPPDTGIDPRPALEAWAGVECSVVRVGDRARDQMDRNGHADRIDDLDRVAGLGVRAFRQPVLWERTDPAGSGDYDWSWPDARLDRLRALGVRPIVGLVHHGAGPLATSLVDDGFAAGLARYAGAVAARYPWVDDYTPVNEPLTTARFSGLYGHWHPHGSDEPTFVRTLLTQCRAVSLAMAAIRAVNPRARLVQTEDLGRASASPSLRYQADFENLRRWLSLDLLAGRVGRDHPLRRDLRDWGAGEAELAWFADHPCLPDLVGINHYLTSNRYLDRRIRRYPAGCRGGNGLHAYADVEAVRVRAADQAPLRDLLREAADRYGRPVAVTEAHLGGTREEQVRWLAEVWREALAARAGGADVRAVTAWAAFGLHDWDSLMTRCEGRYEPGLFDARSSPPRPTALAGVVRDLAAGLEPAHPVLDAPGWWHRPDRFLHRPRPTIPRRAHPDARTVVLLGPGSALGRAVAASARVRGLPLVPLRPAPFDRRDPEALADLIAPHRPWAVLDASGRRARPGDLAAYARLGVLAVECPARSRAGGERARRPPAEGVRLLTIRTGSVFAGLEGGDFLARVLRRLAADEGPVPVDVDRPPPSYAPDLAEAVLDLMVDGETGAWHLAHPEAMTRLELVRAVAGGLGLDASRVIPLDRATPVRHRAADLRRSATLPPIDRAIGRLLQGAGP